MYPEEYTPLRGERFLAGYFSQPASCWRLPHPASARAPWIGQSREPDADSSGRALSGCFQVRQDLFGVPVRLDVLENVLDLALRSDHERRPRHAPDFLPVHVLLFHDAEGLGHLLVGVSQQGERETLFVLKLLLRFWGVGGDPKQHGARLLNLFI